MEIPTVTEDDLRRYHAQHFPHAPTPAQFVAGAERNPAEEEYDYEDDGLGFYEDGVKRTLTDEEIAIFRHSEIQAIIRERRYKIEASTSPTPELEHMDLSISPPEGAPRLCQGPQPTSPASASDAKSGFTAPNYTKLSEKSKARNAKNRNRYRKKERAKKKEKLRKVDQGRKREQEDEGESDEWDPWHQATGPDVQKDEALDLDY